MDGSLIWVMAANAVIWLGVGSYVAFLSCRQRRISSRLLQLEKVTHAEN